MIVYYSDYTGVFFEDLEPLSSCLLEDLESSGANYVRCPSFQEYIKNTFVIRSKYDYELILDKKNSSLISPIYDQNFFNQNILVRNLESGLFTLNADRPIFFSERDLEIELIPPIFHNTVGRNVVVPGKFNIGKHFRALECALHCFDSGKIKIKEGDPIFYVKFLTKEKIKFKKFFWKKEKFLLFSEWFVKKRNSTKRILPLEWYYERSLSKSILKEIKNNLID